MINENLNKKGALEAKMLISIILLIAGFGIILFMYSQLNWTGNIDRQICHESVILRGTLPEKSIISTKDVVPLKCKTKNICMTSKLFGKGDCNEFGDEYDTIRISESKKEQEIKMAIAREMADCWSMMGEGKVQVFSRELKSGLITSKGVICSNIAFDNSIKSKIDKVEGIQEYLEKYNAPNKDVSYLKFFTNNYPKSSDSIVGERKDIINLDKEQSIIFVEFDRTHVGFFFLGPIGDFIQKPLQNYLQGFKGDFYSGIFLREYSSEGIKELDIDSFESIS
jgi:hypothetical protein|tara:strand:- start:133 stop:975 length:843 start_codon:yes stop_codon:yes gene_type:complete